MRILPKRQTVFMVYPLFVGQYIIISGDTIPWVLLLMLVVTVLGCMIYDIYFLVKQVKKLKGE